MRVLLTGAFGNIGICALEELVKQGHRVRCFDIKTKANEKIANKFLNRYRNEFGMTNEEKIEIMWGNLSSCEDVSEAVTNCDAVIHLAALIPPASELDYELTRRVNLEGTRWLISAVECLAPQAKFIFASSVAVFGNTQNLSPPRTASDKVITTDLYTWSKIWCENSIRASALNWLILRLGAALSPKIGLKNPEQFKIMFQIPLNNRIEFLHPRDAGLALANAVKNQNVWGKVLLVGGGAKCQLHQRYIIRQILENMGVGMFPDNAFGTIPYYTDWLDTTESQNLLNYQQRTFDDFIEELVRNFGWRRYLVKTLRPLVRKWILKQSSH